MNVREQRHSSGLSRNTPRPTEITVHSASRALEIRFDDGRQFRLPFEFLRVFSPSAEVRGHGPGQERLQVGKRDVTIQSVDTVGHYAVQLIFSDGHDTGLYSWDYLYELGINQEPMWADYLQRLERTGASRDPGETIPQAQSTTDHPCQGGRAGEVHGHGAGPSGRPEATDASSGWTTKSRKS
jgi:DUF971 family protein